MTRTEVRRKVQVFIDEQQEKVDWPLGLEVLPPFTREMLIGNRRKAVSYSLFSGPHPFGLVH
jgi:hypothetical protein